jgi:hypothetical protein
MIKNWQFPTRFLQKAKIPAREEPQILYQLEEDFQGLL